MNNKDVLRLARECGGAIENGPGDEPTTCGMMFWQGDHMNDYPALFAFGESIRRKERERLKNKILRSQIRSGVEESGGMIIGRFDMAMLKEFEA